MSVVDMDTETALSTINARISSTNLKETYFLARHAFENVKPTDNDYSVDILENQAESLRTVLVDFLYWSESELDDSYAEWVKAPTLD